MSELSLYHISTAINEMILSDEVTEEEKAKAIEILTEMLKEKSADVIGFEKNIEYMIGAMKEEEERIKANRKALENKLERYKTYIESCMNKLETTKIETARGNIVIQKNPMSVEIVNEEIIPNKYKKQVVETKVDKEAIKRDFKNTGELIEGVKFITDKTSVRFK